MPIRKPCASPGCPRKAMTKWKYCAACNAKVRAEMSRAGYFTPFISVPWNDTPTIENRDKVLRPPFRPDSLRERLIRDEEQH